MKLGMVSADPQKWTPSRRQPKPSVEENGLKNGYDDDESIAGIYLHFSSFSFADSINLPSSVTQVRSIT